MKTKISYASEEGLKELYRRAVSRIPDVDTELDYYSENPIANSTVTNALANLASYLVVPGTGSDHHPNIPSGTESEMVLYFVKVASRPGKDNYKEWIWTGKWECIGEPSIVVDDALNIHSMNPITNHAVTEAMLNFGGFEKVNGTGADHHPDVANPSTKVIYLVEVPGTPEPDHCMEWIWEASGKWVCIGSTSIDVDTELDLVSGNPLANSTITAEIDRIDTRIDEEHDYTEGKVEHLEDEITRLDTTKADIAYVDQAILDNTFVAEFNVTTYDAVKTAYQSGKRVICKVVSSGTEVYVPLSISTNVDNGGIMFNGLITYTQSDWIRVWKENGETHWSQTPYQLADKSEMVITPGTGADFDKTTIQLKANTSATVLTAHQDISGKADQSYVDTIIQELSLVLSEVTGMVSGTTMTVHVANSTYTKFIVPATIETLLITIDDPAVTGNASRSMFEFTLPEDAVLDSMRVINAQDIDCLSMAPMTWPGGVTYQGTVTNGIATVIGHAPMLYNKEWISTSDGNLLTTSSGQKLKYVFKT